MTQEIFLTPITGYKLNGFQPTDSLPLFNFERACAVIDGSANLTSLEDWNSLVNELDLSENSLLAINDLDQIAFCGWFEIDERAEEILVFLDGRVHPDFRGEGYGTSLMDWLESTALKRLKDLSLGKPCTFRIMYYDRAPDAPKLFEKRGFSLQYVEQEMERDLQQPLPEIEFQDLEFNPWSEDNKSEFYTVYCEAFQTRSDQLMSPKSWHQHFANPESADFLQDHSLLVYKSGIPVAYAVIHADDTPAGQEKKEVWLSQIGVDKNYRGKSIGTSLLIKTMEHLLGARFQTIKLSVNINNPGAIRLYDQLGFKVVKNLTMYHRPI